MQGIDDSTWRTVRVGARSTLLMRKDGAVCRHYHDTGICVGPIEPRIDDRGRLRGPGGRRLEDLIRRTFPPADEPRSTFRGLARGAGPPPHLRRALTHLADTPRDVAAFARQCAVETSTAWCYAARIVEHWPHLHRFARVLVYPPLMETLDALEDRSGTLRALMHRLPATLHGEHGWRCLADRYAHLRLGRLCAEAGLDTVGDPSHALSTVVT